jgi:hypothetical protein
MQDFTIATRQYHDFEPSTGITFELCDRLVQKACGALALFRAGLRPGDPEVEEPYTVDDAFSWYQDCPFQLTRCAIVGE